MMQMIQAGAPGYGVDEASRRAFLFPGDGEMVQLCRAFDWASTPLGPVSDWPQSLCTIASTILASRHPMFLWWGPDLVQIYNDAYRPSFGDGTRHPRALGAQGREFWTDIWDIIGPEVDGVLATGEATWHVDQLVPIERNGTIENVWWTYSYSPVRDDEGLIAGVLVVVQETTRQVTALAEREGLLIAERTARADADAAREALVNVFAQAPVAIAVLDGPKLRYTVANPKYRQLIGNRDPVGKTLLEMFPEMTGSTAVRDIQRVYDTGAAFAATDMCVRFDARGDGVADNYYDVAYQPLLTGGAVSGVVLVAVDVTDRRAHFVERERLLGAAQRARVEAEAANRSKSEFLAIMSHELRTPLNAIGGYAELIELGVRGPVTAEQRADLARIQQSQRHLLGLISGVLNYSRVEAGAVQYALADVSVLETMTVCEALTAPQVRARGLTLTVERGDPTLTVRADREKLQQILLNLLTNAVKFTDAGGHITVRSDATDDSVTIAVQDTGRGIPAAKLEVVFEPFVQVDARLTRTSEGVGLGLAISRDLARGMAGDLTVVSVVRQGSTFSLRLPRVAMR